MTNEQLAKDALHKVWIASLNRDEAAFIKQREALTNLLDAANEDAVARYVRQSTYPDCHPAMPNLNTSNGNRPIDNMWNYVTAKETLPR